MKKVFSFALLASLVFSGLTACAQGDKANRPSPPAKVTQTVSTGATISIDYSQPALKGRTIGTDVEPMAGKVWRTGANEATVFETDKDIMVEGQKLSAGKYGLFTIMNGNDWTIIFNKTWNQWGAFDYKQADDVLRVNVKSSTASSAMERMTFMIDKSGKISLIWGTLKVDFTAK